MTPDDVRAAVQSMDSAQMRAKLDSMGPDELAALDQALMEDPTLADEIGAKDPALGEKAKAIAARGGSGEQAGEDAVAATPEEQRAYDDLMDKALQLIYSDQTFPRVLETLQAGAGVDISDAIADAGASIMKRLVDSAAKAGATIPEEVKLPVGAEIVEELAGLATKAGIAEADEKMVQTAFLKAVDRYRRMQQGEGQTSVDPNMAQADMAALQQVNGGPRNG